MFLAGAGCRSRPAAAEFAAGVSAVRQQTREAFAGINALVRQDQLTRASDMDHMDEAAFTPIFSTQTLARYQTVFDQLQAYADHLADLSSDRPAAAVEASWHRLGDDLARVSPDALPGRGVSAAIGELARLIVKTTSQRDAARIARQTDPAVQQLCHATADLISSPALVVTTLPAELPIDLGVRQNVVNHWNDRRRALEASFAQRPSPTPDEKQRHAAEYAELLRHRDAQLAALDGLRQSLLQLAHAHAALAGGEPSDVSDALDFIHTELRHTRDLLAPAAR